MRIDARQDSGEVRAALITAVSHVYAAGLQASNSSHAGTRRLDARGDVDDFLEKLATLGS